MYFRKYFTWRNLVVRTAVLSRSPNTDEDEEEEDEDDEEEKTRGRRLFA
jgi:hypothetical protein